MGFDLRELREVLLDTAGGGSLLTIQPGGNYGDNLIYKGLSKLIHKLDIECQRFGEGKFRHDGLRASIPSVNPVSNAKWALNQFEYLRHRLTADPAAIYIHGGGNFNDLWSTGIQCYRSAVRFFDCPIVVGPQSCIFDRNDPAEIFEGVSNETHFFCRERYSSHLLDEATEGLDHVSVHTDHDTALYLDAADLVNSTPTPEYTLLAFRSDKESCNPTVETKLDSPLKARDLSVAEASFDGFVDAGAKADRIVTDRLHGAVLGVILEKPVVFYDNIYHKNRGVYEYSLADKPTVQFEYLR